MARGSPHFYGREIHGSNFDVPAALKAARGLQGNLVVSVADGLACREGAAARGLISCCRVLWSRHWRRRRAREARGGAHHMHERTFEEREVLRALVYAVLKRLREHHYRVEFVFVCHGPEVRHGVHEGSLGGHVGPVRQVFRGALRG